MQNPTKKLELAKEYPPAGEENVIAEVIRMSKATISKTENPVPRQSHAKSHGCVKGEFIVESNLPKETRFGVFKEPQTYYTWIRFSNGSGTAHQPDSQGDNRGMSIKLLGVDGEKILSEEGFEKKTQDFILMHHPVFFVPDVQSYIGFFQAAAKRDFVDYPIFAAILQKKITNPLEIPYWSTTPYKLGPQAIKFAVRPQIHGGLGSLASRLPQTNSENYLREAMVEHLRSQEARFDFLVQFQTDPNSMPIEDPTVEWSEELSPYIKIATIKIPVQEFDFEERRKYDENLSFTPWHSLPDHQPIGGVNRARKMVYISISKLRHELNKELSREPTEEEFLNDYPPAEAHK